MEALRSTWTDERLDDLNGKVDGGFSRVEGEVKESRKELREEVRGEVGGLRSEMNVRFDAIEDRFAALNRTLIQCACGLVGSIVILIVTFVLTGR